MAGRAGAQSPSMDTRLSVHIPAIGNVIREESGEIGSVVFVEIFQGDLLRVE